jgi:hypothetical protein
MAMPALFSGNKTEKPTDQPAGHLWKIITPPLLFVKGRLKLAGAVIRRYKM